MPRLFIKMNNPSETDVPYLTLSHSWGKNDMFKLLKSNIDELQQRIPLDKLSQTFKDAMKVTLQLGFKYLWIDSLCIIQDFPDDWVQEAATMAAVYENSTCNIAALGLTVPQGCFVRRNPLCCYPCRLFDNPEEKSSTYACKFKAPLSGLRNTLDRAPLLTRAWVVQERLLAPRNIYFGADELCWECREHGISEQWPFSMRPDFNWYDADLPLKVVFENVLKPITAQQVVPGRISKNHAAFLKSWHKVLTYYTETNLTFAMDRVVALAGIAGAIAHRTSLTYVAGIWQELWPHDLMWRSDSYRTALKQPPEWRAPSWSWASRDGKIEYDDLYEMMENTSAVYITRVVDYKITPSASSRVILGEIAEAVLMLTGYLRQATMKRDVLKNGTLWSYKADLTGRKGHLVYADEELPDGTTVFFFLMVRLKSGWTGRLSAGNSKYFESGLVLIPCEDKGEDAFRRVGYFRNSGTVAARNAFDGTEKEQTLSIY